tara:strand:- start:12079 stop:14496 length:2418 start_codon:yes stop_codon:yes gene_type:complete
MIWFKRIIRFLFWTCLFGGIAIGGFAGLLIWRVDKELPDVSVLKDVRYQTPLRIYTSDGVLMAEYGEKRRIPVPFDKIPKGLVDAVLATEDHRFYEHPGIDIIGLLRASVQLAVTGTKSQGGSTITMQVARNFFLTRKKTYSRKIREILLAIKIDRELSKDKILDLYLNKIYLGNRAYGVAAAAQVYYGKKLEELTLPQMAMLAGLPKAPSKLNPLNNPEAAIKRRNHVLYRMYEKGYIDQATYEESIAAPLTASYHSVAIKFTAPYVSEMARKIIVDHYGKSAYTAGFNVYTTVKSQDQASAEKAIRDALLGYDTRHGYRGPITNYGSPTKDSLPQWQDKLRKIPTVSSLQPAAVLVVNDKSAAVMLSNGAMEVIPWQGMAWARKEIKGRAWGKEPQVAADILTVGDVVYVEKIKHKWRLSQIPEVQGALISINPHDGAILAMSGGFDYFQSKFNRATQANRQAGSAFKPFIYAAALEKGFTLATTINDAPIVVNDPTEENFWRPQNSSKDFFGPTRLRVGLMKSRNLVSIRLLSAIGVPYALDYVKRFGFEAEELPNTLSLALGAGVVSPLQLATGYAVFANGGYRVEPYLIDHVIDSNGNMLYKAKPAVACEECIKQDGGAAALTFATNSGDNHLAPQVVTPQIAYLMTSALQDVIQYGTGRRAKDLNRHDLAGKTGTTNDQKDAWFAGFNSDAVTISWVGFDTPKSIHEYGAQAALPMWKAFMSHKLLGTPESTMERPPGLVTVRINPKTGYAAPSWMKNAVFETFREEYSPTRPRTKKPTFNARNNANDDNYDESAATLF